MTDLKRYEITLQRPVKGVMHRPGETVTLSDREYAAEAGWGGLAPVAAAPLPEPDVPVDGAAGIEADPPRKRGR